MPEWKTYKGQPPWALEKQGNKFGYINNPNFHSPATEDHNPCGYWYSSKSGVIAGEALPKRSWVASAISADGKYMTAVCREGEVYSTDDYGMTWAVQDLGYDFYSVFMNSTGQYRIAGSLSPSQTIVSNDYGVTWTSTGIAYCINAVLSDDGRYQTIALGNSNVYVSSNYGATWARATGLYANKLAMSSSGRYQLTGYGGASSWKSDDYGATWSVAQGWNVWNPAMSQDGKYQLLGAAYSFSDSFKSSDYGTTWQAITLPGILHPYAYGCCVSSSGQHMALINAEGGNDYIYVSNNYGVTWTKRSGASLANWSMLIMSDDGQYLTAIQYTSGISATQVIYMSNDFGVTWDISGSASKDWKHISNSSSSQYQIAAIDGTDFLYASSDFGIYWKSYFTKAYETSLSSFTEKTVWSVDGAAVAVKALEVGDGKDFETFGEACSEASTIPGSVLLLVFPGSYESGGIISGSNRTVYVRGMGASPLDVEFLNCCPQVSGAGHNLFLENIYIHYTTGAGFTSIQFSSSMGNLDLNKVQITDPNVPVEYTPFLAGLTWAGNLTASYTTLTATWNWELVFFQFDPSKISFNKVSYVGGYWGESSCAVQFATYNPAVSDCGALFGSFRITEEIDTETLSLTPLWPSTRWQTFDKDLYPWIVRPITSLRYNEGDKIAIAPQVSGGSPVWDMEHNGIPVTGKHDSCKYWSKK